MREKDIIKQTENLLQERHPGGQLLYLIKFGSFLYGTQTENSDLDLKGIFLPSFESLILQNKVNSISFSTGENSTKNCSDDVDIELWSLQYWLSLVGKWDTGGLDLLFSNTNPDSVLFEWNFMDELFKNPLKLFDPKNVNSYIGYCNSQAKKYGIKGSRLGIVKQVYEFVGEYITLENEKFKLSTIVNKIIKQYGDNSLCFIKNIQDKDDVERPYLFLCGKQHQLSITIREFFERIKNNYEIYGERARLAEKNNGLDYKALSHALRCINQYIQLLTIGEIKFPLTGKSLTNVMNIKNGNYSWKKIEDIILKGLDQIDLLRKETNIVGELNSKFVKNFILKQYDNYTKWMF